VWRAIGVLVLVLVLAGDLISEITRFDTSVLASFGLPRTLTQPLGAVRHRTAREVVNPSLPDHPLVSVKVQR